MLAELKSKLKAPAVAVQLPMGAADTFSGVIDLVKMSAYRFSEEDMGSRVDQVEIPSELAAKAEEARAHLIETVADVDEILLEAYMENSDVSENVIKAAIRRATIANQLIPVLAGSSLKNKGVQPLLDAVTDYLPSPLDIRAVRGLEPKTDADVQREASDFEALTGLVFKMATDKFIGKLAFVRVYAGHLKRDKIFLIHARRSESALGVYCGCMQIIVKRWIYCMQVRLVGW